MGRLSVHRPAKLGKAVGTFVALSAALLATGQAQLASADSSGSVTSTIAEGNTATAVGSATLSFTGSSGGGGTVMVTLSADSGDTFSGGFVCLSATSFTSRINPAMCAGPPFNLTAAGGSTTVTAAFIASLGTGDTLYAQIHVNVSSPSGSAFAGWQAGTPFYGNLGDPIPTAAAPTGPGLFGLVSVAAASGAALGLSSWRTRSRQRPRWALGSLTRLSPDKKVTP